LNGRWDKIIDPSAFDHRFLVFHAIPARRGDDSRPDVSVVIVLTIFAVLPSEMTKITFAKCPTSAWSPFPSNPTSERMTEHGRHCEMLQARLDLYLGRVRPPNLRRILKRRPSARVF